jgi:GH18 family chitinase
MPSITHRRPRQTASLALAACLAALIPACSSVTIATSTPTVPDPPVSAPPAPTSTVRLVGYLPDYNASYAVYAKNLDFTKMTHLILAFGLAPLCNGTCTASSNMTIGLQQTDADIATLVTAAHAAGVKVLISLGGGVDSSDDTISQFYLAGLSTQFAAAINQYVTAHNLDGVDVDIEDASTMGAPYGTFVAALAAQLHPQGRLLTAAMYPYLQPAIPDSILTTVDFVNVETYSTDAQAISDLNFYVTRKSVPAGKLVLGVPFYGATADQSTIASYSAILAAYPNAWQNDQVSGGPLDNGATLYYVGETTMATETKLGAQYGGVMIWELTQDAAPPHSLLNVIQSNL